MNDQALARLVRFGWRLRALRVLSSRTPVVLMYHGIPRCVAQRTMDAAALERHLVLLRRHFDPVDYRSLNVKRRGGGRIQVILTFDDGFKNNFDVAAPILRKYGVPAIFFVSSRHSEKDKYLWFAYVNALLRFFRHESFSFKGLHFDMSAPVRKQTIERLAQLLLDQRPHPAAMYRAIEEELPPLQDFMTQQQIDDHCAGMTAEQVRELAKDGLFTIGAHTHDHPLLSRCEPPEIARQIRDNLEWIQAAAARSCELFAYPGGVYDETILAQCRTAAFKYGFAISPQAHVDPTLEIPRVGLYAPSAEILGFKVQWGHWIRLLNLERLWN